jgi:hypothetical protein
MIALASSDFVALDLFTLKWRFTPDRTGPLAPGLLARIRPLTTERAEDFAAFARSQCEKALPFGQTFRSDDAADIVRAQLRALSPAPSETVLVSWDAQTAVATDWEVFVALWDDFCYPASDDVTIWPLDQSWILCYRHHDIFQFSSSAPAV